jgi:hypothetical protein
LLPVEFRYDDFDDRGCQRQQGDETHAPKGRVIPSAPIGFNHLFYPDN